MMPQPLGQRLRVNNGPEYQSNTPGDSKTRAHLQVAEKT